MGALLLAFAVYVASHQDLRYEVRAPQITPDVATGIGAVPDSTLARSLHLGVRRLSTRHGMGNGQRRPWEAAGFRP